MRSRLWRTTSLLALTPIIAAVFLHLRDVAGADREPGYRVRAYAITNARIVVKPGHVLEKANLILRDGMIEAVGPDADPPEDAEIIDGTGLTAYAGFLDSAASLGARSPSTEPQPTGGRPVDFTRYALAETRPDNRKGLTPEFRAADAIKLDADYFESRRKQAVTAIVVARDAGLARGQGALISTSGAPPREAFLNASLGSFFSLAISKGEYPSTLMGATAHLRQAMLDAAYYREQWSYYDEHSGQTSRPPVDPVLDALGQVLEGDARVFFHASTRDEIHRALNFCEEFDLKPILVGGAEAWKVADRIKDLGVPVIVSLDFPEEPTVEVPKRDDDSPDALVPLRARRDRHERWQERVGNLAVLHEQGIPFALCTDGLKKPEELTTNLRKAIEHGLPREAALGAFTTEAARILGVGDRLGTLEPGKVASVALWSGDFDDPKARVRMVFVDGMKFEYREQSETEEEKQTESGREGSGAALSTDLSGTWKLSIPSSGAVSEETATLELKHRGRKLSGVFRSENGDGKITNGSATTDSIRFTVAIGAGADTLELRFQGRLEGDRLTGTLKPPFGAETEWHATRESDPQTTAQAEQPTQLESDRKPTFETGGNVLIRGATVLPASGPPLENTSILVRDGKIAALGRDLEASDGVVEIDAHGLYVMPGIIDTHSHIAIKGGVNEATQSIVAEVRVKDAVRSDDVRIFRALAGGVTTARLLHGSANVIGGQDAVIKLRYGKPAHALILHDAPQGIKFALGENVKRNQDRFPNTRMGVEATIVRAFTEARAYRDRQARHQKHLAEGGNGNAVDAEFPVRRDLRLEALAQVLEKQVLIHSHCYRADEILMLLRTAERFGIRVQSLQHVLEGYKVAPEIAAHGAFCSPFADWWAYKIEAYDAIPYNAALLLEAGVKPCLKSDDAELMRHMNQEAAKMVRYGAMSEQDALKTITLWPAEQLGLEDRIGSIEIGKDADLALFNGHPLNSFARCEMTLVDGEVYFQRSERCGMAGLGTASIDERALQTADLNSQRSQLDLSDLSAGVIALKGATVYPVSGPKIENGTVLIEGDKIAAVGSDVTIPPDAQRIDVAGLEIYPGLIDAGTTLGLIEVGAVRETHDFNEGGLFQPDLRTGTAINPDSELIPVARAGGITTVLSLPTGGVVSGRSSLIKLSGWTAPEMNVEEVVGLHVQWPRRPSEEATKDQKENRKKRLRQLDELFTLAKHYNRVRSEDAELDALEDPRMEAMLPFVRGRRPVIIEADRQSEIAEALKFAEKHELKLILSGATDAWKLAEQLKQRDVAVITGPVMTGPLESYDPYDAPYANAHALHAAGVRFCIRSNSASNSRNAPFEAAQAVAYGLPAEEGLKAVTLYPAQILGVSDRLGSIEVGKLANLIITTGNPLQPTSQIKGIFIAGEPHEPVSKQTRLYEKYQQRMSQVRAGSAPLGLERTQD